ncbi:hypothetical protein M433DRAFT_7513 [Acidomyces richmondensis BFW]|nr:hypothetical protein M433DRAFT_7513 [Acidomyces richmondensis BFW]
MASATVTVFDSSSDTLQYSTQHRLNIGIAQEAPSTSVNELAQNAFVYKLRDKSLPRVRRAYETSSVSSRESSSSQNDSLDEFPWTVEELAEEEAERKKFLESGLAQSCKSLERLDIPPDIAEIYDLNTVWIRRSWKRGLHPALMRRINIANNVIRAKNDMLGRGQEWYDQGYKKFKFPGENVMIFIDRIYGLIMEIWKPDLQKPEQERNNAARDVAYCLLNLRALLEPRGIPWKSCVTSEVTTLLFDVTNDGMNQISDAERSCLQKWIYDERAVQPVSMQLAILHEAAPMVKLLFDSVETQDEIKMHSIYDSLQTAANKMRDVNIRMCLKADDREIQIPLLKEFIEHTTSNSSGDFNIAKKQFAAIAFQTGMKPIAKALFPSENLDQIFEEPEVLHNNLKAKIRELRMKYLFPADANLDKDSERVVELTDDVPASSTQPRTHVSTESNPQIEAGPQHKINALETNGFQYSGTGGPPEFDGLPGPLVNQDGSTRLGKIVSVRNFGREYRVILNIGSEKVTILECLQGANFGKDTIRDFVTGSPSLLTTAYNIRQRKAIHVSKVTNVVQAQQTGTSSRTPATYFMVEWKSNARNGGPLEEILTRSELAAVLGRKLVDGDSGYLPIVLEQRRKKLEWIDKCKAQNLHPDTGKQINPRERESFPWIFSDRSQPGSHSSSARQNMEASVSQIQVGDGFVAPAS